MREAGKSIIERIATFLAALLGVTAFGSNFLPAYLRGNLSALVFVVCLLQMGCVDLVSSFSLYLASVTVALAVLVYAIGYA
jgi:hypothetical protein